MANSIRKSLLGFSLAAAGGALMGAPVLAAPAEIAQNYGTPVEVVEVESVNGWYLTVGAGAVWPSSRNYTEPTFGTAGNIGYTGGFSIDGGIGYDFGAIRAELTYGYSNPSVNSVSNNVFGPLAATGRVNKNDILASLYWDVLPFSRFTPYIGGGIGYTNLGTPNVTLNGFGLGGGNRGLFGWQAKVGLSYALAYNWDLYAEGTYSGAGGSNNNLINLGSYNDFGAKLGFRYRFAQPEVVVVMPEPAPAPAPAPAPIPAPEPAPEPAPIRGLW